VGAVPNKSRVWDEEEDKVGSYTNSQQFQGPTALFEAKSAAMIRLLMDCGADANLRVSPNNSDGPYLNAAERKEKLNLPHLARLIRIYPEQIEEENPSNNKEAEPSPLKTAKEETGLDQ
jgi:hypothetical protein